MSQKQKKLDLVYQIHQTIQHHFPELFNWMKELDDYRKKQSTYELSAHLVACLGMFLFKMGSRNEYNHKRDDVQFHENYKKLFKQPMPHADSVKNVMELLDESQVEKLKEKMVKVLFERKVFHQNRYQEKWFCVAIDASGVVSFDHKHCEQCLHTTSKKGKTTYFHNVLEACLVTSNGFCISLASLWIENPAEYEKQDCERKAFIRLAKKLKSLYPRLPILILADGLYPYKGFFDTCRTNSWSYIVTFKDGNLPSVWSEVYHLIPLQIDHTQTKTCYFPREKTIEKTFRWVDNIDYKGHSLNWLECTETINRTRQNDQGKLEKTIDKSTFVHITNLPLTKKNIASMSKTGRLRWHIENEGFNTLKNGGYGMQHKFSRKSYQALKNYFQFMLMAYIIHQLMTKCIHFQEDYLRGKNHITLKKLWHDINAAMEWAELALDELNRISNTRIQCRLIQ